MTQRVAKGLAIPALLVAAAAMAADKPAAPGPSAPVPRLAWAFSARVEVAAPVELGEVEGGRRRFIAITGGKVSGPRLSGQVVAGGGDWQTIRPGGLTEVLARYFLRLDDGTLVEVTNPGLRVAAPEVIERLARGELVDPAQYYFRTSPQFKVAEGRHGWLARTVFVARGIRMPDHVVIDFYVVE